MKKILLLACTACMMSALIMVSCKKGDTGPQGPAGQQGTQGPQGPQGVEGNANVTLYTYGPQNLSTSSFVTLTANTTEDTMHNSAWMVYLFYSGLNRWYSIPGYGVGASTMYRVSVGHSSGLVNIYIDKVGGGEDYAKAKVVRIYSKNVVPSGGRGGLSSIPNLPDIDLSDYEAVRSYYNLKD